MGKLPKNPKKGQEYTIKTKTGRKVTFKATGKSGFGKYKITKNVKA